MNCIFITNNFPPLLRISGCRRTAAISKYLAQSGCFIFVLTMDDGYAPYCDEDRKCIPTNITLIKTKALCPKFYKSHKRSSNIITLFILWLYKIFLVPDRFLAWVPCAYRQGLDIIEREKIDIIYSSGEYFSSHIAALLLHNKKNIPWIAEFRDPWSKNPSRVKKSFFYRIIDRAMERTVVKKCNAVIAVTPFLTHQLQTLYPSAPQHKFFTIPNGYDPEAFPFLKQKKMYTRFTLCYCGSYGYRSQSISAFMIAVTNLIRTKRIEKDCIDIHIWGGQSLPFELKNYVNHPDLDGVFFFGPYLSFEKSLEEEQKSHVLLFFDNDPIFRVTVPAKLYECLGANKPVLAFTYPNSFGYQILSKTRSGKIILDNNIEDIEEAILSLYAEYYATGTISHTPMHDEISPYRYQKISSDVLRILKSYAITS